MSKFFDFCNNHKRTFVFCCFIWSVACLLLPPQRYIIDIVEESGEVVYSSQVPFFVAVFGGFSYNVGHFNFPGAVKLLIYIALFCMIFAVFIFAIIRPAKVKWLTLLGIIATSIFCILPSIYTTAGYLSIADRLPYIDKSIFQLPGNAIAMLVLFFLYIIYLLLRRYYAPVKARILASRAERQANRKPTKDERIAELERKVAELESKGKDEQ